MKNNRRDFLKKLGLAGLSLTGGGKLFGANKPDNPEPFRLSHRQQFNMHNHAAPALETVRIGFIGIGSRGSGHVERFARIEGVEIKALCDVVPHRVDAVIEEHPSSPDAYTSGEEAWKELCEREDIDLVIIATPWALHAPQAVYAMEQGKHVGVEVPAAKTVEECWELVETSEQTRRHCMMLANSAYGDFNILTINMARQGFFGEIVHGEGAYIHDRASGGPDSFRWERDEDNNNWFGYRPWRLEENANRNGNLYPTHGLGTICQAMDLNYGDQMDYMVSMSGNDFTLTDKMKQLAAADDYYEQYLGKEFRGNMNTSIIRTHKGRTIMLQHDISSPRPNVRFNVISGTRAIAQAYPRPSRIATSHDGWLPEDEYRSLEEKYRPEISGRIGEVAKDLGGHGGVDTMMAWRLIDCLRNGVPLDMDVYDAALWSCIAPLSEWSVANRSNSVAVPDFTSGAWKTNERNMDIELKHGGTTKIL